MITLLLFIGVFLSLCVYFFVAPFYIEINTTQDLYRFRFHKLASVSLIVNEIPVLLLKIAGWRKEIRITGRPETKGIVIKKKEHISRPKKRRSLSYAQVKQVLKSFKVKTFYLDADFDDIALNGILYPFFYWLSWYSGKTLKINFNGNTVIIIVVQNNIARMSWALISSKLKTNPS